MSDSEIKWQRWPLREEGGRGWLKAGLVLGLVAGLWLVLLLSLPPAAALLLGAIFAALLLPYFLPSNFVIGPEGIGVQRGVFPSRQHRWQNFGQVEMREKGFWLIPTKSPPAKTFAPLRALFLPYPLETTLKPSLAAILQKYLPH